MECMDVAWKPRVGLQFDTLEAAWKYWCEYGRITGFGVRKQYWNRRKVDGVISSCRYVCCKEGHRKDDKRTVMKPRAETRTDCLVRITLFLGSNNKYVVHEFVEEHNHPLQVPETTHMLASHRNITEVQAHQIDLAESSGLQQKSSFQLMSTLAGHRTNVGYTPLDAKNYLKAKRQRGMLYGEVGCLMECFQRQLIENPSFFHAYQMDAEEQITNVFWADAKMVIDYRCFGEVISLDTTYCTNQTNRPLTLFSGFNHYQGVVIFRAALLYDETAESFKWLFETFLEAHNQKQPQTIFTDQDQAMAKEKWASCYLKDVFTLGMRSTQLSESLNSDFKACMKPGVGIKQFFAHFERVVEDKRYNELKHEYDFRYKLPMLRYEVEGDPKLSTIRRYRHLAGKMIRLACDVSTSEEYCQLVDDNINNLISKITKLRLQTNSLTDKYKDDAQMSANNNGTQPRGFKLRPSTKRKGNKRFKSWVELQANRKKSITPILDQSTSQGPLHDINDSGLDDI
ncbi:protein FAR1-RELATED SEQUENCE 5-like [Abrus precatorius]|uniref:Protein FAR1-RELATED SEQUENCE 5-like n=1 Tax=Abrus precatorius TaxID=3816 RepID=A0A8B8JZN8_ABRPR|nr:protein FAR1-RELATED SEQUENCE 5-like [Abrus precatorius]